MRTTTLYLLACLIFPAAWGLLAAWAYSAVSEWRRSTRAHLPPRAYDEEHSYTYEI